MRAVHDRYDGTKHNPWNLIECGDHYSRAMASWGCLLAVTSFVFDASEGKLGFAPRLTPEDFKTFFAAAEGWGSLVQKRSAEPFFVGANDKLIRLFWLNQLLRDPI